MSYMPEYVRVGDHNLTSLSRVLRCISLKPPGIPIRGFTPFHDNKPLLNSRRKLPEIFNFLNCNFYMLNCKFLPRDAT